MSLAALVERAKAESLRERRQPFKDAAELLRSLPELMAQERALRGLTRTQAAQQAGVPHSVWGQLELRHTSAQSRTSARILEWMANG